MSHPVIDLLQARKKTRAIAPDPLPDAVINDLIEAIRLTPSCFNKQPWKYLFLESEDARRTSQDFFTGGNLTWAPRAPLIVIGYARRQDDCVLKDGRAYYQFDVGMSAMNLMLAATHHGLTARPTAGWDSAMIREFFKLEEDEEPLIVILIGYPSADESHIPDHFKGVEQKPRIRKEPSDLIKRL